MGRVSKYQQGQLASSLVGTAGVDNSGAQIAQDMLQSNAQLAGMSAQVSAQQSYQRRANVANAFSALGDALAFKRAVKDQRDTMANEVFLATASKGMREDLVDLRSKVYTDLKNNPDAIPKAWKEGSEQIRDKHLGSKNIVGNVLLQDAVLKDWTKQTEGMYSDVVDTKDKLRANGAKDALRFSADETIKRAGTFNGDVNKFNEHMLAFNAMKPQFEKVFTETEVKEIGAKVHHDAMLTFHQDNVLRNPEQTKFDMDNEVVASTLSATERNNLKSTADSVINANIRTNEALATAEEDKQLDPLRIMYSQANINRKDPNAVAVAKSQIVEVISAEMAKPLGQQNRKVLDKANTYLDKINSFDNSIDSAERRVEADARAEVNQAYTEESRAWTRENRLRALDKQRTEAVYNSKENEARRIKAGSAVAKIPRATAKIVDPISEIKNIAAAKAAVDDAYSNGAMSEHTHTSTVSALNARRERAEEILRAPKEKNIITQAREFLQQFTPKEKEANHMLKPASPVVHDALRPANQNQKDAVDEEARKHRNDILKRAKELKLKSLSNSPTPEQLATVTFTDHELAMLENLVTLKTISG